MKGTYMNRWKVQMYYQNKWKNINKFCNEFYSVIENQNKDIEEIVKECVTELEIFPQNPFDIKL